jgi:hypothetical protein
MTATASAALLQALALSRAPRTPRPSAGERLPEGTLQLVRIAAGEEEAIANAQAATLESAQTLREAAIFYIQQVFFAPGSNSYRVLGVDPDASDERLREHYRWLARWLHPDRNPDQWEVVFAERVNSAWQDLRTSERRARYQLPVPEPDEWSAVISAPPVHLYREAKENAPPPPRPRDLRWVPPAVVAVLGSAAIGLVVLFYSTQRAATEAAPVAEIEGPAELPDRLQIASPIAEAAPVDDAAGATSNPGTPVPTTPEISAVAIQTPPVAVTPPPVPVAIAAPAAPIPVVAESPAKAPRERDLPASPVPAPPAKSRPAEAPALAVAEAGAAPPMPQMTVASATVDVRESPESVAPAASRPGSRDANRLLGQLSRAYEAGDIQGMRALFAPDAQGPGGGLNAIMAEYRRVFADSSERSLSMRDVSCFVNGDTFTIVATFEANVTSQRPARSRKTRGDLRLDLRREGDRWQIYRMQHGERPG